MNLDDLERFKQLDTLNMLGEIDNLPDQLASAYQLGMKHALPDWKDFKQVVIAGMGGSAIGADLLASYCASRALCLFQSIEIIPPLFARGSETRHLLFALRQHRRDSRRVRVSPQSGMSNRRGLHRRRTCETRERKQPSRSGRSITRVNLAPRDSPSAYCSPCSSDSASSPINRKRWKMRSRP